MNFSDYDIWKANREKPKGLKLQRKIKRLLASGTVPTRPQLLSLIHQMESLMALRTIHSPIINDIDNDLISLVKIQRISNAKVKKQKKMSSRRMSTRSQSKRLRAVPPRPSGFVAPPPFKIPKRAPPKRQKRGPSGKSKLPPAPRRPKVLITTAKKRRKDSAGQGSSSGAPAVPSRKGRGRYYRDLNAMTNNMAGDRVIVRHKGKLPNASRFAVGRLGRSGRGDQLNLKEVYLKSDGKKGWRRIDNNKSLMKLISRHPRERRSMIMGTIRRSTTVGGMRQDLQRNNKKRININFPRKGETRTLARAMSKSKTNFNNGAQDFEGIAKYSEKNKGI